MSCGSQKRAAECNTKTVQLTHVWRRAGGALIKLWWGLGETMMVGGKDVAGWYLHLLQRPLGDEGVALGVRHSVLVLPLDDLTALLRY